MAQAGILRAPTRWPPAPWTPWRRPASCTACCSSASWRRSSPRTTATRPDPARHRHRHQGARRPAGRRHRGRHGAGRHPVLPAAAAPAGGAALLAPPPRALTLPATATATKARADPLAAGTVDAMAQAGILYCLLQQRQLAAQLSSHHRHAP
ncbi:hypothetical protein ACJJTC_015356 [Scirpophaga incertulas]